MSLYTIFLFVHVTGAIGYSAGTLISVLGLSSLRRARRVEQVRSLLELLELTGLVSGISLLLTTIAGLYMAGTTWGWQTGWIDVALGSLVLLLAMGVLMGRRRHVIAMLAKEMPDGPLPAFLEQRIHDPCMALGVYMLVTLVLGIVFLMTVKPAPGSSLLVIGVSVLLGVALSLPGWPGAQRSVVRIKGASPMKGGDNVRTS
ncbi:MAG: hypothetical protein M5U01_16840 [Ardenticatenaceae bacterium]|nr:hypothetical protein [Ardenticatenaceae bacterium]